jgi:hypothetical protein
MPKHLIAAFNRRLSRQAFSEFIFYQLHKNVLGRQRGIRGREDYRRKAVLRQATLPSSLERIQQRVRVALACQKLAFFSDDTWQDVDSLKSCKAVLKNWELKKQKKSRKEEERNEKNAKKRAEREEAKLAKAAEKVAKKATTDELFSSPKNYKFS